ncbi:tRNA adenosine(34) deaminase TadA [Methylicorpusculum oleiharenae]|uniref:tRNA adenosine(34) deaminase TadA n=1 Tax=Methylicorpusculum oleiharenae TaxID=1338687 RepID=UPI001357C2C8|nr:tRNA adenosine(34) deaminase TadA [Methylicorpusculum oleiharenae]
MGIETNEADEAWMRHALRLAQRAEALGEVPVGAVIVKGDRCIAEAWNSPIATHDPSAHAEILVIREAGKQLQNYRLIDTTLYVTLEPCVMCMGAIVHARIGRLVFGARDEKRGAVCSVMNLASAPFLNHKVDWSGGVMETICSGMLKDFFKARR